jgi:shikimate kinase
MKGTGGKPIVLIGFMATGKTTVGRLLAERLGRRFVDLDRLIEETAGTTVAEIFRSAGEPAFRKAESRALDRALAMPDAVVATGGGAACREDNLAAMLARGRVVALSANPAEVLRRTGGPSGRPLLDGAADPLATAARLLEQREEFYGRAHLRIDTVGKTPEEVAEEILAAIEPLGEGDRGARQ